MSTFSGVCRDNEKVQQKNTLVSKKKKKRARTSEAGLVLEVAEP
jgi:hypothetical protein